MNISWETFKVHTAHPFGISRGVKTGEDLVWFRLEHEGIEGWGEAAPQGYYGESAATVEAALQNSLRASNKSKIPSDSNRSSVTCGPR